MRTSVLTAASMLWLTAGVACAQGPQLRSDLNTARYDRDDTLRAVKHLFMQRSKATRAWLQMGTGSVATGAVQKAVLASSRMKQLDKSFYAVQQQDANADLVVGGLTTAYGLVRASRFGPRRYQQVRAAYAQGAPLPAYLTRKLKTKYFRLLPPL